MIKQRIWKMTLIIFIVSGAAAVSMPAIVTVLRSFGLFGEFDISGYAQFFLWKPKYLNAFVRSAATAGIASAGAVIFAVPAAYVFAKVKFPGRSVLFFVYIIVMIMPFQVTLLPHYMTAKAIGSYDTLLAVALPGIFAPFSVFLITQVIKSVPDEILEAARIDTSNPLLIIARIIIPIIRPGIICAAVLAFTEQWNMVAEPVVLLETPEKLPLAVLLGEMSGSDISANAATVIFFALPFILFGFFEEEIIDGLGEYRMK